MKERKENREKERERGQLFISVCVYVYTFVSTPRCSLLSSSLKSDRPQAPWGRRYYMLSPWKVWEPARGGTRYLYLGISPSLCHNAPTGRRYTGKESWFSLLPALSRSSESSYLLSILFSPLRTLVPFLLSPSFSQSIRLLYAKLRRPSAVHAEHDTALGTIESTHRLSRT